tara:strand:+ start:27969 stop:29003 length:1035 start_codon:yes stop_codon:yes gene_type:complete
MDEYQKIKKHLTENKYTWLITGIAGFIGSNLMETLLKLNQKVIGLDNLSTGYNENIDQVINMFEKDFIKDNFKFFEGDVNNLDLCNQVCKNVDYVLHQAALGSVPRSVADPISTHDSNINGFLNMLIASRDNEIKNFVYASSSSIYGDHPDLPKTEEKIGNPLSPYAVTKLVNEIYAKNFFTTYKFNSIGLRYFNIFGPRQDPNGVYAAVIPKWISAMINEEDLFINGDGKTTRDFCFIENVMQANIISAVSSNSEALNQVYNIAVDDRTSLLELHAMMSEIVESKIRNTAIKEPIFREFQDGDVRHSKGSVEKAQRLLNYKPSHTIDKGLEETIKWFIDTNSC